MNKAAIFDFNGTLFQDSKIHHIIWQALYSELFPSGLSFDQVFQAVFGANNIEIIKHFYRVNHQTIDEEEAKLLSERKEALYRQYCRNNRLCHLTKGATKVFEELTKQGYHLNIATASIKANVDFFFSDFPLASYFDRALVVFDDGSYLDKTAMYQEALRRVEGEFDTALVFEDSVYGVNCAKRAGFKKIYVIDPDLRFPETDVTRIKG